MRANKGGGGVEKARGKWLFFFVPLALCLMNLLHFRSVFGQKRLEKRLESESSDSDEDVSKGKLKRQHPEKESEKTNKATDLLVEVCFSCKTKSNQN